MSNPYGLTPLLRGVIALGLIGWCLRCHAEATDAQVHLTPAQAAQFQTALTSIADQAHVAVVTEGVPLNPLLKSKDAPDLTAGAAVGPAIQALADAYDYDTQRVGSVFVLTKRYSSPQDLPCVTLAECRASAQAVTSVLDTFNPHFAESFYADGPHGQQDAIVSFFGGLSASQMAAAQSKTLRYAMLSPDQQDIVRNLFLFEFIQMPADRVTTVSDRIDAAEKGTLTLLDPRGFSNLFLELSPKPPFTTPAYLSLLEDVSVSGQKNPRLTLPLSAVPARSSPVPPVPTTLGAVVDSLTPIDGRKPTTEAPISGKPVTAFGLRYATSTEVMRALAALYGLRNGASPKGSPQLETVGVIPPTDLKELDAALWASLPVSLARALHLEYDRARIDQMRQEAKQRLLVALQPQIKKSGQNMRVPVSSLDDGTQDILAALLMTDVLFELQNSFSAANKQHVIDCFDNMDQTIISTDPDTMAVVHGQQIPSFSLTGTDPETHQQIGLGSVRFVSRN